MGAHAETHRPTKQTPWRIRLPEKSNTALDIEDKKSLTRKLETEYFS